MKRILTCVFAMLLVMCSVTPVFAGGSDEAPAITSQTTEVFADGSYGVITVIDLPVKASGTVSKTKSYSYYDSGNTLQWTVSLTAMFTYTGTSATCTAVTPGHTIYNSDWRVTNETASRSGATATGDFTVKKYLLGLPVKTVNKTLTLTCTANGVVS